MWIEYIIMYKQALNSKIWSRQKRLLTYQFCENHDLNILWLISQQCISSYTLDHIISLVSLTNRGENKGSESFLSHFLFFFFFNQHLNQHLFVHTPTFNSASKSVPSVFYLQAFFEVNRRSARVLLWTFYDFYFFFFLTADLHSVYFLPNRALKLIGSWGSILLVICCATPSGISSFQNNFNIPFFFSKSLDHIQLIIFLM